MRASSTDAKRVVFFVVVTVFLDLVGFGIIIPILPLYVKSMGGDAQTVGFLFASFAGTQFFATPILGRISDRFGRRRVILLSLAGNAASMILFALATHEHALVLLFVSRILAGATAGNISACQAAVADVTEGHERAAGMGRVGAGIALGMIFGPVICSVTSGIGVWAPPLAAAALATLDFIGALFWMPETHGAHARSEPPPPSEARSLRALVFEPRVAAILALFFMTFLYMTNLQVALALLAGERLGWNEKDIGFVFFGFGVMMLVVQGVLIGRLTRTFGTANLVVLGAISSGAGLFGIAAAHTAVSLSAALALLGLGLGVTQPLLSTLASEQAGATRKGELLGIAQSAGGAARTVGPVIAGALYKHIGPGASFVGGGFSALIALAIAMGLRSPRPPSREVPVVTGE